MDFVCTVLGEKKLCAEGQLALSSVERLDPHVWLTQREMVVHGDGNDKANKSSMCM